jgi:hypothetical protein
MDYCSYEDAFPQIGPSSTGCKDQKGSESARKEERRRAKKCKGPALTFLDPDRPALQKTPDVPALNKSTEAAGPREHTEEQFVSVPNNLTSQRQPDDEAQMARNTLPTIVKNVRAASTPAYFGASGDEGFQGEEATADVIGSDSSYRLFPDFKAAFQHAGMSQALASTGSQALASTGPRSQAPTPSVVDQWKPLTPSSARTAFFDELPPPGGTYPSGTPAEYDHKVVSKKLDLLFSRLDDLESRRGENTQTEILLFVMSGLFVLFSMDIVTRQSLRLR